MFFRIVLKTKFNSVCLLQDTERARNINAHQKVEPLIAHDNDILS